jgi:hypothetical protein
MSLFLFLTLLPSAPIGAMAGVRGTGVAVVVACDGAPPGAQGDG